MIWTILLFGRNEKLNLEKRFLIFSLLTLLLFCTVGGLGNLFTYFVTAQLRCNNRASIVIDCVCLSALLLFADEISPRMQKAGSAALLLLTAFCFWNEIPVNAPGWQQNTTQIQVDYSNYFQQIETTAGKNAMIYQLPFRRFPEEPALNNLGDYDDLTPYLFTKTLRWSHGGIKGRDTEAEKLYINGGMGNAFLHQLVEAGFSGILIQPDGYADRGNEIITYYEKLFDEAPMVSPDNKYFYFCIL